jgi:hypothetical protein
MLLPGEDKVGLKLVIHRRIRRFTAEMFVKAQATKECLPKVGSR